MAELVDATDWNSVGQQLILHFDHVGSSPTVPTLPISHAVLCCETPVD